jgi:WD40 repeat protein
MRQLRGDLEWITIKALEKDRTRRYASASEFGADLECHLADVPVMAGPPSASYRLHKFARRHRGKIAAAALLMFAIVGGLVVSSTLFVRAERQRDLAEWEGYKAHLAAANAEIDAFRADQAKELLFQCPARFRGWEWKHLYAMADSSSITVTSSYLTTYGRTGSISRFGFRNSPRRPWLATHEMVKEIDLKSGAVVATYGTFGAIITMSRDARRLVRRPHTGSNWSGLWVGDQENIAEVLDLPSGRLIFPLRGHKARINAAAFNRDGSRLATASVDGEIRLWNTETGKNSLTIRGPKVRVRSTQFEFDDTLALSPDGKRIVFSLGDSMILWDANTGRKVAELTGHNGIIQSVVFSVAGDHILSAAEAIRTWDAATGRALNHYAASLRGGIRLGLPSLDNSMVFMIGDWRELYVFNGRTELSTAKLVGLPLGPAAAAITPDSEYLIVASMYGDVKAWDLKTLGGHVGRRLPAEMIAMATSGDGLRTAAALRGGVLEVWENPGGGLLMHKGHAWVEKELQSTIPNVEKPLVALSFRGTEVAVARPDKVVYVWKVDSGELQAKFKDHDGPVNALSLRPDGMQLSSASGSTLRIWDLVSSKAVLHHEFPVAVSAMTYSPDGSQVAVGLVKGAASQVVDVVSGAVVKLGRDEYGIARDVHPSTPRHFAFSPDGSKLAVMRTNAYGDIWNPRTGTRFGTLNGISSDVFAVAFSPDGNRILSAHDDKTIRIWDGNRYEPLVTLYDRPGWDFGYGPGGDVIYANAHDAVGVYGTHSAYSAEAEEWLVRSKKASSLSVDLRLRAEKDRTLSPSVRQAVLKSLEHPAYIFEVYGLIEAALLPDRLPPDQYALALRRASAVARSRPSDAMAVLYTGMGQYRTGALKEAVVTLEYPLQSKFKGGRLDFLRCAVLAMTCQRLSQPKKAREYLELTRQVAEKAPDGIRPSDLDLLREAERVVQGRTP